MTEPKDLTCAECQWIGLDVLRHAHKGMTFCRLNCPVCGWQQPEGWMKVDHAVAAYERMREAQRRIARTPSVPDPLAVYHVTIAQVEALQRMAAAAEQQAADVRAIREVLETLLDNVAAEVQP